jgi:hypothetical protein
MVYAYHGDTNTPEREVLGLPMTAVGWVGRFSYLFLVQLRDQLRDQTSMSSGIRQIRKQYNPRHSRGLYLGGLYRTRTCDPYHVKVVL